MAKKNRLADMTMDYSDIAADMFEDGVELDTEVSLRVMANMTVHKMRRIQSEMALEEKLPWYWEALVFLSFFLLPKKFSSARE